MSNGTVEKDSHPLVSVVVVNYNSGAYLAACVRSLVMSTYPNREFIIVDNASTDGSLEQVRALYPEVTVVRNAANLGYSRAGNIGIAKSNGEFVVIMNPDMVVDLEWLEGLVEAAHCYPHAAFFQPKILLMGNPGRLNSAGNMIHVAGFGVCRGIGSPDSEGFQKESEVCYTSGACNLVRKKALADIGPMEELFFAYGEDKDWGWRALMMGWQSIYVPTSKVLHKWRQTLDSPTKFYLLELERPLSICKNYSKRTIVLLMPVLLFAEVSVLVYAAARGWLLEKLRSYVDLLRLRRVVFEQRRMVQKRRAVPDRVLVRKFVTQIEHPYVGAGAVVFNRLVRLISALVSNSI